MTAHSQRTDKTRIVVLMGGPDAEAEVSLASGRAVAAALRSIDRFDVRAVEIETIDIAGVAALDADVIVPMLHGPWGEGGPLQLILERAGVPFVGSPSGPAALAMDKCRTKRALRELDGFATPVSELLRPGVSATTLTAPAVVKPIDDGSSVGVMICRTRHQLADALADPAAMRRSRMVEQFIEGREVTVGIVCDEPLPLIEIRPAVEFYDYQAKYDRDDTRYIIDPTDLPPGAADQWRAVALAAHRMMGCRDLSRVDFIVDDAGVAWFLEINTMPGFTSHSLVPKAAAAAGINMADLCARLVDAALAREHIADGLLAEPASL